ncbi:MAG: TolC family protein [Bdellovibrionaceae bacterium]|nr:TolC family protein [Pseudobdellovibrionaceae bacterium]
MKSHLALSLVLLVAPVMGTAMTLEEYLAQVRAKHRGLQSLDASRDAATNRREAGDIGLSPVLTFKATSLDDKKPQNLGAFVVDRNEVMDYSLGLGKTFTTGTTAQVTANTNETKLTGRNLGTTPPQGISQTLGTGSLGLSLSQSLWKGGFGSNVRLRQERELQIERTEKQSYDLQAQQILIQAESAYWDALFQRDELKLRQDSLERARRIESWVRRRVSNGIGDDADSFTAQGLVAGRELQLLIAQDDMVAVERRLRDILELPDSEPLPPLSGTLTGQRRLDQMSQGREGRKIRLDSYLAVLEAKTKAIVADEIEDSYKPDLVLEGAYRTNSAEPTMSEASTKMAENDKPTQSIGLKLVWLLDGDVKNAARRTAKSEALASALKKERQLLESDSAWAELNRRHGELTKKIQAAKIASDVQTKKASAQRDKLNKGRAITSDVITAEQDAAEALSTFIRLQAEQRKLEAQGRLFVTFEE